MTTSQEYRDRTAPTPNEYPIGWYLAALAAVSGALLVQSLRDSEPNISPSDGTYILQEGDTLSGIANRICPQSPEAAVEAMIKWNHIPEQDLDSLAIGIPITLPDPKTC